MLKDSQITVQAAILTALQAAAYISNNSILVLDTVPKGTVVPYITIGDMTVVNDSTQGIGFQTITLVIHTWDQALSSLRLKSMMGAVMVALDDVDLTLTDGDFTHINSTFLFSQVFNDPDGLTKHGVQKFRIEVQNT
jgi:Protein of unknown function (DUF3168)